MSVLPGVLLSAVLLAAVYYLVALGLNIIFGVLDIVNFAHGALVLVGAYFSYELWAKLGLSVWLTVPIVMVGLALFGIGLYAGYLRFITPQPLVRMLGLIGVSLVIDSILLAVFGANFESEGGLKSSTVVSGVAIPTTAFVACGIAVVIGLITLVALRYTRAGSAIRAIIDDRTSAQLCGINDAWLTMAAFAIGCGLAGAGGTMVAATNTFGQGTDQTYAVIAFSVVILGGLGDLAGGALAALIIALAYSVVGAYSSASFIDPVIFVIVLATLVLRPRGLLGGGRV